jgi:putative hydrolase of the HAD superfamily
VDTLKVLQRQGYRLGLFSNATDDHLVQRLVNQNRLRPWLAPTFSSAGCGWRKPKREGFDLIAARWALPAGQIVVVGDTPQADILGARNAGMPSILMARNEATGEAEAQLAQPTATASSLAQLPDLISQL